MITPLSRDSFLSQIQSHSVKIGLDLSHSFYFDDVPNSVYLCINHPNGDIALAVSCMEICEKLTPDVIASQMDFLNSCPYVVLDANRGPTPWPILPIIVILRFAQTQYPSKRRIVSGPSCTGFPS